MALNGIKVSIIELDGAIKKLKDDGDVISAKLKEVKGSMDVLKGTEVWSSEGATEIQKKFDALCPKFDVMKSIIDDYVSKLEETKSKYNVAEDAVVGDTKTVQDWA